MAAAATGVAQNGLNYIGNPDYRGYLNYQSQNGNQLAGTLLGMVDNSGNFSNGKSFMAPYSLELNNANAQFLNQWNGGGPTQVNTAAGGGAGKVSADFVNQAYDTKISGLRSVLDTLNPQQDAAVLNVNNQFQNQSNTLQSQKATGERNLGIATDQVQAGKVKSLADLNRQVQTMGMSYNNQLGAYGAGDSSAAGMVQQALSGMASKNRANVIGNANQQQQGIDLQMQDLNTEFTNNMKSLEDWKNTSLNDIATKFLQQRQAIQQQMVGADADRYQALAQLDSNYVNQAISQLGALEAQYRQGAQDLIGQFQNVQGPSVAINPQLQQFAVQPISAGQLGQLRVAPSVSAGNQPLEVGQRRPFEEDYGIGF